MTLAKSLQKLLSEITVWRKGEQRAPHKPLLVLYTLSQYRNGHARLFDYASEVQPVMHTLLERYGPHRREYRPDMPFWRLKGDGFWELLNAEHCSSTGSRQPPAGELERYQVAGGFDVEHFELVKSDSKLIDNLAQQILRKHSGRAGGRTGFWHQRDAKATRSPFSTVGAARLSLSMCDMWIQYAPRQRPGRGGSRAHKMETVRWPL